MTITIYQCLYELLSINYQRLYNYYATTCTSTKLPPMMTNDSGKQSPKLTLDTQLPEPHGKTKFVVTVHFSLKLKLLNHSNFNIHRPHHLLAICSLTTIN